MYPDGFWWMIITDYHHRAATLSHADIQGGVRVRARVDSLHGNESVFPDAER